MWYAVTDTKCNESNTLAPSRKPIDVSILQTQGGSVVPDTKMFIIIQISKHKRVSEGGREREREILRVYEERNKLAAIPTHHNLEKLCGSLLNWQPTPQTKTASTFQLTDLKIC